MKRLAWRREAGRTPSRRRRNFFQPGSVGLPISHGELSVNIQTIAVTIFTLWLVMGLGFLATYTKDRKANRSFFKSLGSAEGLLFVASVAGSIIYFFAAL